MAVELQPTPTDELTGLPLPLVPLDDFGLRPDWHHHYHPRRDPLLQGVGGKAVRGSRLQHYDHDLHYFGYHGYYAGPPLPTSSEEQFTATILSLAGYMPDQAIDLSRDEPRIVGLSPDQRHRLQTSGEMRIGIESTLRRFVRSHIMKYVNDTIDIDRVTTEEFLETKNYERQRDLGHNMLGLVIARAVEPVEEIYRQAQKNGMLAPGTAATAHQFTKTRLGTTKKRHKMITSLRSQLAAA